MFEAASRMKLRFVSNGVINVEDLWDLPLEQLNTMFKALNKEFNSDKEESLLTTKKAGHDVLALKINLIKHVVKTRLEEEEKRKNKAIRNMKLKNLKQELANKEANAISEMSKEDLIKQIEEMEKED